MTPLCDLASQVLAKAQAKGITPYALAKRAGMAASDVYRLKRQCGEVRLRALLEAYAALSGERLDVALTFADEHADETAEQEECPSCQVFGWHCGIHGLAAPV